MCGIAGKISLKNIPIDKTDIFNMLQSINHRGPDDEGIYINNNIGLGHKRLSIIDLSPKGHQPMTSNDGQIIITFNGEIYNFKYLRNELQNFGYRFKSKTDTEVIIYLYKKYGTKCLEKLRGIFAFVIFDKEKNILFGARDRLGVKPLKYFIDDNNLIFASELKSILTNKEVKKEVDHQAIYDYLSFSYVPHPRTGFENIKKLPQAHYFILNLNNNKFDIKRYWDIDYNTKLNIPRRELKAIILDKLEESVKLRMISDVPLGVFLSGGVDSSLVTHFMSKNSSKPIKSFSIRSRVPKYDENKYIQLIVDKYKTDHHELFIEPNSFNDLEKIVYDYEEPFGDSSMLPLYNLSKYASDHITVSLCGEGGDEDFGGYSYYLRLKYLNIINQYPKLFQKIGTNALKLFRNKFQGNNFIKFDDDFLKLLNKDIVETYYNLRSYLSDSQKNDFLKEDFKNNTNSSLSFFKNISSTKNFKNIIDKIFYTDFYSFVPNDLMTKLDIASMANGIEGRVPLLDHELVELCAQMPPSLKTKGLETKYFLKKSLEGLIPNEIIYRSKMGFGIPVNEWFRGELKSYLSDIIFDNNSFILSIFKKDKLMEYFNQHLDRKINLGNNFWNLLTLELWHKNYFKN